MNKKELALLEKAFSAQIDAALNKSGLYMMQTKAKLADDLVEQGFLRKVSERLGGPLPCTVSGYALTEAGWLAYCLSCCDEG